MTRSEFIKSAITASGHSESFLTGEIETRAAILQRLQHDDDEAAISLDLVQISKLASLLRVSPRELLRSNSSESIPAKSISFAELASLSRAYMEEKGLSLDDFENLVGWNLEEILAEPDVIWLHPAVFVLDLCQALGVPWLSAIPLDAPSPALVQRAKQERLLA